MTYVGVLIEFFLSRVFKQDLVSLFLRVIYLISIFKFVAFIDKVSFLFPDCFPVNFVTSIYYWITSKY